MAGPMAEFIHGLGIQRNHQRYSKNYAKTCFENSISRVLTLSYIFLSCIIIVSDEFQARPAKEKQH